MTTKTIDSKGRLTLGTSHAGKTVQVQEEGARVVITFCAVVPERERWLWENDEAFTLVDSGLREAHAGELTEVEDLTGAFSFGESIADDE